MSEPLGVEERARLRALAEGFLRGRISAIDLSELVQTVPDLLAEVDRLTEALDGYRVKPPKTGRDCTSLEVSLLARAERAEADLAELRAGVEALIESADCNQRPVTWRLDPDGLRKLLL